MYLSKIINMYKYNRRVYHNNIITSIDPATTTPRLPSPSTLAPSSSSSSGRSFCTLAVSLSLDVKQLAVPQSYPLGQHPASGPPSSPQRNQPPAHVSSASAAVGTSPSGTTTVRGPDATVVDVGAGQLCVSQSRSVRQHPPPWVARQP